MQRIPVYIQGYDAPVLFQERQGAHRAYRRRGRNRHVYREPVQRGTHTTADRGAGAHMGLRHAQGTPRGGGSAQCEYPDTLSQDTGRESYHLPDSCRLGALRDIAGPLSEAVQDYAPGDTPRAAHLYRQLSADDSRDAEPCAHRSAEEVETSIDTGVTNFLYCFYYEAG